MAFTVAVSGKGGTGKTTVSALLVKWLIERGAESILAVDADPNTNFDQALGVSVATTVGDIREEMLENAQTGDKERYLEYLIYDGVIVEGPRFDYLAMGRPEGPGCYCYVNHLLRRVLDRLTGSYDFVVMDTEAGLEHLSRRTTRDVDVMLVTVDGGLPSIRTAERIRELALKLENKVRKFYAVPNRVSESLLPRVEEELNKAGFEIVGHVPEDKRVMEYSVLGKPLLELPRDSEAVRAVSVIAESIFPL